MLNITKTTKDTTCIIMPEGRIDTMTAPQLDQEIKDSVNGVTEMILDFEKVNYISSAGLRVLLNAQKALDGQGTLKVCHVNETVMEILEVTGFTDILGIE